MEGEALRERRESHGQAGQNSPRVSLDGNDIELASAPMTRSRRMPAFGSGVRKAVPSSERSASSEGQRDARADAAPTDSSENSRRKSNRGVGGPRGQPGDSLDEKEDEEDAKLRRRLSVTGSATSRAARVQKRKKNSLLEWVSAGNFSSHDDAGGGSVRGVGLISGVGETMDAWAKMVRKSVNECLALQVAYHVR